MATKPKRPIPPSTNNYSSEFKRLFERLPSSHSPYRTFDAWLEICACTAHQGPYHLGFIPQDDAFHQVEAQYMQAIQGYTAEELQSFAQLYGLTTLALHNEKSDFLGRIFMELELGNSHAGQFFTPYPISLLMAQMTIPGVAGIIQEQGFFTLQEPASGGGGMLIAVAQVLTEMGHDPGQVMLFEAVDISRAAFNMSYIQASLTGLCGYVRHGNTLSCETWEVRFTPIAKIFWWRTRYMLRALHTPTKQPAPTPDPAPSAPSAAAAPPPPAANVPHQSTLFDLELPTQHPTAAPAPAGPRSAPVKRPASAEVPAGPEVQATLF